MPRLDFRDLRDRRARVVVFGAMAAQMAMGFTYARGPLTPALIEELGWSRGDLMAAGSPSTWMTAIASPIAGYLTQRYGARPVITFGVLMTTVLGWGFSELTSLWQVFALGILTGCVIASVGDVAVGSVVAKWINAGRGFALGVVYSGSNLGGSLAAWAAALLLGSVGWRQSYLILGLASTALLLPIILLAVREPQRGFTPASLANGLELGAVDPAQGIPLRLAVRTPSFWLLGLSLFLFYVYFIGVNGHLTLYLVDLGYTQREAGQFFAELVFLGVAAKIGVGLIADRWPAKTALLINFSVVVLASFLLIGLGENRALAYPFVLAHGAATMAQNVVYPLIVAWCFGTRYIAEIYGMLMLALLPGGTLGPIALGYMHDWLGSYDLAFQILAGLNIVCFAMLAALRPFSSLGVRAAATPAPEAT